MKTIRNEWNDPPDLALEPPTILISKKELLKASVIKNGDNTRPLTRKEKKELNDVLNQACGKPSYRTQIINLIVLVSWTFIWILVAHYVFHF